VSAAVLALTVAAFAALVASAAVAAFVLDHLMQRLGDRLAQWHRRNR
jgi:ABC-type nitrate/sulfonate/bicarbonate transport system permease component